MIRESPRLSRINRREKGAAILEFAIVLPLLVVFVVGIYDFSGAFNQKQKIAQAAQEGAILAGAQPTNDIASPTAPDSLIPVVTSVFNSLAGSGVVSTGACTLPATAVLVGGVEWKYSISCGSDSLIIDINRGWFEAGKPPTAFGTVVQVSYPYHFRFNSVIQLLLPGSTYAATTNLKETATVHTQI
jgi:hypothetical protein